MKKVISLFSIFSLFLFIVISSCNKNEDEPLPPIGGYNNSDEIGIVNGVPTNVAKFSFEGTNIEVKGNISPITASGTSFTTGVKGQGLTLTNGYILYPALTALGNANALNNASLSGWVKVGNNDSYATCFFALTQSTVLQNDWNTGPLMMFAETAKPTTVDDTLVLKGYFSTWIGGNRFGGDNINDYGVRETDFKTVKTGGTWVHVVVVYNSNDNGKSTIDVYANGIVVSNKNFRERTKDSPPVPIGPIVTVPPVQAVIGAFPTAASGFPNSPIQGWQKNMNGSLDELRVYTKALTADEISALYQLEKAGR